MHSIGKPIVLFKSGFVVCRDAPFLWASPDGKVIDAGCSEPYGLVEVKCPETKYRVSPLDACSDPKFYLHEIAGKPQLKRDHNYYAQVQGQVGVTHAKWCDFIIYSILAGDSALRESNMTTTGSIWKIHCSHITFILSLQRQLNFPNKNKLCNLPYCFFFQFYKSFIVVIDHR